MVDWSKVWRMSSNEDKCKTMFIDRRRHNLMNMAFLEEAPLKYEDRLSVIDIQSLATRRRRGDLIQYFKIYQGIKKVNWIPNQTGAGAQLFWTSNCEAKGHTLCI